MIEEHMIRLKNCDRSRRWLYSQLSTRFVTLDADKKAIKQINFTGNSDQTGHNNIVRYWRSKINHFRLL